MKEIEMTADHLVIEGLKRMNSTLEVMEDCLLAIKEAHAKEKEKEKENAYHHSTSHK